MTKIDLNKWAQDIANREGKKINLNITQIKELINLLLDKLAEDPEEEVKELLDFYRSRKA
jgi:hypothetical protein